jgi:hypothetical protein
MRVSPELVERRLGRLPIYCETTRKFQNPGSKGQLLQQNRTRDLVSGFILRPENQKMQLFRCSLHQQTSIRVSLPGF